MVGPPLVDRQTARAVVALLGLSAALATATARGEVTVLGPSLGGYSAELQLSPECRFGDLDAAGSPCLLDGVAAGVALGRPYIPLGGGDDPAALGLRGGAGFALSPIGPLVDLSEARLSSLEIGFTLAPASSGGIELRGRFGLLVGESLFGDVSLGGVF